MSPVSVVVAENCDATREERALATCQQTMPFWLRHIDDTFTAVHKDEMTLFVTNFTKRTPTPMGVLTIYTGKPEIPVGKSNGSRHSVWEASENMGCNMR